MDNQSVQTAGKGLARPPARILVFALLPTALMLLFFIRLFSLPLPPGAFELSLTLACVLAGVCIYAVWLFVRKTPLFWPFWIMLAVAQCAWLVFAVIHLTSVRAWDTAGLLMFMSVGTVAILLSMLELVRLSIPADKPHSIGKPLLFLLIAPALWYLVISLGFFSGISSGNIVLVAILALALAATYGFLFLLMRTLLLLLRKNTPTTALVTKIVFFIVLPALALIISQLRIFSFFWDFSSPLYYILIAVNGALFLLPQPKTPFAGLALFFCQSVTYVFALYFFFCLAPFYALSLVAMLALGGGLLILSPLFMTLHQSRLMLQGFRRLRATFGALRVAAVFLLGLLIIPAGLGIAYTSDRMSFAAITPYLEDTGAVPPSDVSPALVRRSLAAMDTLNLSSAASVFTSADSLRPAPPLVSSLYRTIVTGGKVLTTDASARMRALFLGESNNAQGRKTAAVSASMDVDITDIRVETVQKGEDYFSTVHLTLHNKALDGGMKEFSAGILLPDGVFVSNYYLDIEGTRKYGLLSERTAAIMVYERVVSSSRDPGLVYYNGKRLQLRVFPLQADETRTTGIEFVHRGPATLDIGGQSVTLAPKASEPLQPIVDEYTGAAYISAQAKQALAQVRRRPYYAFIIDASQASDIAGLSGRLKRFISENHLETGSGSVTAANYRLQTLPLNGDWEGMLESAVPEGGFGLYLATRNAFYSAPQDACPVVVVLSDNMRGALFPTQRDCLYMAQNCPELDGFYALDGDAKLTLYPFDEYAPVGEPQTALPEPFPALKLERGGGTLYARDDGQPQIVIPPSSRIRYASSTLSDTTWASGLRLAGDYGQSAFYSESEVAQARLGVIENSFHTRIMTPLTAYIVLETRQQEDELRARQKQLLELGQFDGEPVKMSEPPLLLYPVLMALGFAGWMYIRRRKSAKQRGR